MGLNEQLIELTDKHLIACRQCHTIGDISVDGSRVKLVCPSCRKVLGLWETTAMAAADLTAFVARSHH
jgi:hypothetical protein